MTTYSSAAAEDSAVVATSDIYLDEIIATNVSATDRFLHIFDSATLPADTTAPLICIAVPAGRSVTWDPRGEPQGYRFTAGLAVCLSSTGAVKTVTVASEGVFTVRYRAV